MSALDATTLEAMTDVAAPASVNIEIPAAPTADAAATAGLGGMEDLLVSIEGIACPVRFVASQPCS